MVTLRQRLLLIMVMITAAILAWEVYQLFFGEDVAVASSSSSNTTENVVMAEHAHPPVPLQRATAVSAVTPATDIAHLAAPALKDMIQKTVNAVTPQSSVTPAALTNTKITTTTTVSDHPHVDNTVVALPNVKVINAAAPAADLMPTKTAATTATLPLVPPAVDNIAQNLNVATASQAEYMAMVNAYQIAQLQRLLAEQRAAIAIAKRNTAQAEAEAAKYSSQIQAENTNTTANDLNNNNGDESTTAATDNSALGVMMATANYIVKYVDFRDQHWTALLEKGGKLFEVKPGDTLADGAQVASIADDGVTLQQGNDTTKIKFGE